jgi:hypothetical protein
VLGQEVGGVEPPGAALLVHLESRHEVEAKEDQVHEVVLAEALGPEVGVDATKAAETAAVAAAAGKLGNENRAVIADNDGIDIAAPADEEAHLPVHLEGKVSDGTSKVARDDTLGRDAPAIEPFQSFEVTGPETGGMTVNPSD